MKGAALSKRSRRARRKEEEEEKEAATGMTERRGLRGAATPALIPLLSDEVRQRGEAHN